MPGVGHLGGHVFLLAGTAWHQQGRARLDQHARRYFVDIAQFFLAHAHAPGGIGHFHVLWRHPGSPTGQSTAVALHVFLENFGVVPGQQDLWRATGQHHWTVCRRVERLEVVHRHLGQFGNQRHVGVTRQGHTLKIRVIGDGRQLHAQTLRVGHHVFHGLQFGHVQASFGRHAQLGIGQRFAQTLVARQGFAHIAFAPVVGGQGQVPVAKHAVQPLQIVQGGTGGGQYIAAVVPKRVLLQVKVLARARHELPHAAGPGRRHRLRVEGTFNEGQQGQLGGHVAPLQLFNNVKQVLARARRHALDVVGALDIPSLTLTDLLLRQVGHAKAPANALPQIGGHIHLGDVDTVEGGRLDGRQVVNQRGAAGGKVLRHAPLRPNAGEGEETNQGVARG